jgi:mRNA-degrading endonuclease toxin of MazEF toxin-antitoxin module
MTDLESGAIVLVDFSFSDHQQSKRRPALVVSNSPNNRKSRDVIVMKITSKEPRRWGVMVTNEDLIRGSPDCVSFVQIDGIYALEKTIIREVIGMLSQEKMQEIHTQIAELFDLKS